uniref:Uncharacterized protein n=1 Tax=Ciona intestinalis TaxID=7719 RepID=H2Y1A7_CIOIN
MGTSRLGTRLLPKVDILTYLCSGSHCLVGLVCHACLVYS